MALGDNNISLTLVNNYIGTSLWTVSGLVGVSGLNKYSFYAPGFLSVDANKDIVLTPPVNNFKLGDFRRYDKDASTPAPYSGAVHNWGPSGTSVSLSETWRAFALNIKHITGYGDSFTVKYYDSAADRAAETNARHSQTFNIDYDTITPLIGHTRNTTYQAKSAQPYTLTNFNTVGLSDDDTLYSDTYISDSDGNRRVNLGTKAGGYQTVNFHRYANPQIRYASQDMAALAGYAHIFPRTHSTTTPCTSSYVDQNQGSGNYTFYIKALGIHTSPAENRIVDVSYGRVTMTLRSTTFDIYTGAIGYNVATATQISGTLPNSWTWAYDDIAEIRIEDATYGTSYTTC
jgi:hypothetical protein